MTTPTNPLPPPAPGHHFPPTGSVLLNPPPPKRKHRGLLILALAGGFVLLLAVLGIGIAIGGLSGNPTAKPTAPSAWDREQAAKAAASADAGEPGVPADEPTTTSPTPAVKDFALHPKITEKDCYGSAGCNVTLKVQAEYVGPALSPDDTWEITYEINGIEDGPQIGSFQMTGDTYQVNEEFVGTRSSKSKVTIKVTSVEKVGI